jgi:hypothetical protein
MEEGGMKISAYVPAQGTRNVDRVSFTRAAIELANKNGFKMVFVGELRCALERRLSGSESDSDLLNQSERTPLAISVIDKAVLDELGPMLQEAGLTFEVSTISS